MLQETTPRKPYWISLLCIGSGAFLLLVAADVISTDDVGANAPRSIIGLCGLVFVIAGLMVLNGPRSRFNDLMAGILLSMFGLIGGWIALFSGDEGFSGGLPFVAYETNVRIARFLFGIGSLICFAISIWAFRRFARRTEKLRGNE